jgi:two-component system response regulator PilR (NtrC family)
MRMADGDGLELVRHICESAIDTPVAVITAHGSAENAVAALKAGAFDYLSKPVSLEQLRNLVRSALKLPTAVAVAPVQAANNMQEPKLLQLVGDSAEIAAVRERIQKLARSQAPVQISGESGCGKELAARLIHEHSARREGPFVAVNCGAIPENLVESEFFGYKKGAFTGAANDHLGFFQAANTGTLFLDEVGDLPLSLQVKLLRAIQEKRVRMIGAVQEELVDVRIVSATHRNLAAEVEKGAFRQDLFYRLNVIELRIPSLRERKADIPELAIALLKRHTGWQQPPRLSGAAIVALQAYAFPGNVRELENTLERALAMCNGVEIYVEDLQLPSVLVDGERFPDHSADNTHEGLSLPERLEAIERQAILDALAENRYSQTEAAKALGITFRALRYRIQRLGIKVDVKQ